MSLIFLLTIINTLKSARIVKKNYIIPIEIGNICI